MANILAEKPKNITINRVVQAPVKANAGIETNAALKFNKIAMQAPKAAPADTPRV